MRLCGHCHTCGSELRRVLDGEEWCDRCGAYRRYQSHGWSWAPTGDGHVTECPDPGLVAEAQATDDLIGVLAWRERIEALRAQGYTNPSDIAAILEREGVPGDIVADVLNAIC